MLTFSRTFPTTIALGDHTLQIHVDRLAKGALEEVDRDYAALVMPPRGSATLPAGASADDLTAFVQAEADRFAEWNKTTQPARLEFFERVICKHITLDAGQIEDCGEPVTTGEQLLRIFHGRKDVLRDLIAAVISENHLAAVMRKNSNSPRGSEPGSEQSIPARGGDGQGPTAASAASSASASPAAATAADSATAADGPSSSGETTNVP